MKTKEKLLIALVFVVIVNILYINYFNVFYIIAKAEFTIFVPSGGRIWKNMMLLGIVLSLGVFVSIFLNNKYFNLIFYALNTMLELFVFIKIWFVLGLFFYTGIFPQDHANYVIPILALILLLTSRMLFNVKRIRQSLIEWIFLFISSSIYSLVLAYNFLENNLH
ncbi:hypothetical protein BPUTSESOX_392 [uncultured Gammaproteobacteria bacterium]|jgi:hypothetical protein|uniref:hypothetical protein n=1 Tax=thiotrophic endosymbiont of Bathymodiolus puteoserpentis (Logatchev) TaxID=343240 RepID=UPI0010AFBB55|nr:hypothetical protein [thiotrophic endosymbiont of Bathymodiolus puteoserpentis (Logatchev)]CAC9599774.1 hypothetical protein [uncultured Gammaproteobacteria bacterium]CAC9651433.1 hypothetical protein [uncultured Gammaproteobacteria bacterium]SSC10658.1 hypothetical protein BPUTEOSOX_1788 [thiotrophic endosymbiont of Bathymodiolus puteoserpentis (Logatchev)]VVH52010.1 hypothetical protein BPUTSESOX_392 [uncultured Gammaproteobacteria bacterium]